MAKLPADQAVEQIRLHLGDDDHLGPSELAEYGPKIPGKCNAKLNKPDGKRRCKNAAGQGTDHLGYGNCTHHFGSTPAAAHHSAKARYEAEYAERIRFGDVIETDPMTGVLQEIARAAGFIAYLEQQIRDTARASLTGQVQLITSSGPLEEQPTGLVRLFQAERRMFAQTCKIASDMGVDQAKIDLLRVLGGGLAELIESVVSDLGHDPHSPEVERVVSRRLELVPGSVGQAELADQELA